MWCVTAGNGLPRCEGYRWVRFGLLGSSFGAGLAESEGGLNPHVVEILELQPPELLALSPIRRSCLDRWRRCCR